MGRNSMDYVASPFQFQDGDSESPREDLSLAHGYAEFWGRRQDGSTIS